MSAPRFAVIKHIPDLTRFEPRNIGVIVWSPVAVAARLVGEIGDSGDVDGRKIPGFISSPNAYRQWVRFWRKQISSPAIGPTYGASPTPRYSAEFVDALIGTSAGDFLIADSGFLLDEVTQENISHVVDDIYERIVSITTQQSMVAAAADDPRDEALDDICDGLIQEASLGTDPNFKSKFVVPCAIGKSGELFESFEFSHAYKNGEIRRIYQRVPLSPAEKNTSKNNSRFGLDVREGRLEQYCGSQQVRVARLCDG